MVAHDPHPGSLHRQGAGPPVRDRGRRLHVLPGHRPDLPAHRSGHHQERTVRPRDAAPDLHAPRLPRPPPADGDPGRGAAGDRAPRGRPRGGRAQGVGGEPAPPPPALPRGGHRGHPAHRLAHPDGRPVVETRYLVQLYSKLSFPLVHVIMALVAIPFALVSPRSGGRAMGIGLAIVIAIGYWVVHSIALAFAQADLLPAALAAWTANIVFAGIGTALFLSART